MSVELGREGRHGRPGIADLDPRHAAGGGRRPIGHDRNGSAGDRVSDKIRPARLLPFERDEQRIRFDLPRVVREAADGDVRNRI